VHVCVHSGAAAAAAPRAKAGEEFLLSAAPEGPRFEQQLSPVLLSGEISDPPDGRGEFVRLPVQRKEQQG